MSSERIGWPTYATAGAVAVAVLVAMLVVSGNAHVARRVTEPSTGPSTVPTTPAELTFGVWGTPREVAAYRQIAATYTRKTANADVRVKVYASPAALEKALGSDATAPSIYLLPRPDLSAVMAQKRNRPVQDLLTDRGVSLGDDYSRDAVTAFSADDDLQCMPYTVSPMVIYYNTRLIDFDRMKARGLNVPSMTGSSFTLDEFRTAARVASRVHGGHAAGVAIDPSLRSLAPFVYSGGGQLFDNETTPTSLALGQDGSTNALRQTLEVLRDPRLTLSNAQLAQRTPLQWFERGGLGMIAGYRDLVPTLRKVKGLRFDVLPMPAVGSSKTVGDFTGACLSSAEPRDEQPAAADFLTYLVGDEAMTRLARVGSLQPSDLRVAYSAAFQQPAQQPAHAIVFTNTLRYIQVPPLDVPWSRLEALVDPQLERLMYQPGDIGDLGKRLTAIDQRSQQVLAPPAGPSGGPSGTATASSTASQTP